MKRVIIICAYALPVAILVYLLMQNQKQKKRIVAVNFDVNDSFEMLKLQLDAIEEKFSKKPIQPLKTDEPAEETL